MQHPFVPNGLSDFCKLEYSVFHLSFPGSKLYLFIVGSGFSLRAFKEDPRNSLCGDKGSLIMIQGFVVFKLKRVKLLPKYW